MAKKSRPPFENFTGAGNRIPHALLDSLAFAGASDRAKAFLYALIRQHNGLNNGRLQLTDKWLAMQGYPSAGMNNKSRAELIERSLIVQTRQGGLNGGCSWYALTWLPISNFVGLDISATGYHQGAWGDCRLPPTARRKPPQKRVKPSVQRSSTTPTSGAQDLPATPTIGAKETLLTPSATPTTGNNVSIPCTPSKTARGRKLIVGRAGRSGIPKEQHAPLASSK
jgi:hypothetical protein